MDDTQKKWIDDASYERLLERWRNAPPGDSIFIGDAGNYYKKIMNEKRVQEGIMSANYQGIVPCECGATEMCLCGRCKGCAKYRCSGWVVGPPAHEGFFVIDLGDHEPLDIVTAAYEKIFGDDKPVFRIKAQNNGYVMEGIFRHLEICRR